MSSSRRRRSPSPAKPHHAGIAYRMDATVVALATRWSSCGWRPWVLRSLNANIEEYVGYRPTQARACAVTENQTCVIQGRKPRGAVPQSLRWGDGPCIRPPNILRSSVVGCARKYEKSKKGVFLVRKGSCTTFNKV